MDGIRCFDLSLVPKVCSFHCYTFTDFRDGSLLCPETSGAIDRVHAAHVGYDYLADDRYMLAHLFDKEADQIGYLYDFGDKWHHETTVENIFPREQSHGRVEVLEGKGMCPENMKGSFAYNESLQKYDKMSPAAQSEWKREVLATPNYDTFGKPPSLFDPDAFDLPAASARLAEALSSPNSVRWGAKKYHLPMVPPGDPAHAVLKARDLGKGQKYEHTHDGDPAGGFREETTSECKDRRGQTACAQCGNPDASSLKVCSGCRQVMHCSPEHKKIHWKAVHKRQCSRKFLQK